MSERIKIWWGTRTLREQRLLLAMFSLLAIVLLWAAIVQPIADALSRARERHGAAAQALAEVRAQADLISNLERRASPVLSAQIDALISRSATEAGFPITRLERESANLATLASNSVRPQAFFAWVEQMENSSGLTVERLSATTNSDQTLTVPITFRARSR